MKNRILMHLRYLETILVCSRKYRKIIRQVYKYVKRHFVLDDKICNMMQDIWNMLMDYDARKINADDVIPNAKRFIREAFSEEKEKGPSKLSLIINIFLFVIIIPAGLGIIAFYIFR